MAVAIGGLVVLAALTWGFVPWDPVGGPLRLPPPDALLEPAQIQRAEAYSRAARLTGWASLAVGLVLVGWLAVGRTGRRAAAWLPGPWWWRTVLAVALLAISVRMVTLPFAVVGEDRRRRYALSTQDWDGWARDVVTNLALTIVVTSLVLLVLVSTARRFVRAWPAVAGAVLAALVLVGSFVYPVLVEPLFNTFQSLPDGPLRREVLAVAGREGVPVRDVLVADASRRTSTLNAYVSGFGSTRRIVLYDTLVDDLPRDQAVSVVAHELAHAKHRDVLVGSVLGATGALAGVGLLGLLLGSAPVRRRYGARALTGAAAVPLVVALLDVGSLLVSPVESGISRRIETRADLDALRATQDPAAFVAMQRRLAERALSDPTPPQWSQWWFGSHPTTRERVALAERCARTRSC